MADEELVMYIVINDDTKMGKGKIVAQAGHVIVNMAMALMNGSPDLWNKYIASGLHPKIVLKAKLVQMEAMIQKYPCLWIRDAGRTQVPSGTLTALAFPPMLRSQRPPELADLKLL